MPKKYICAFTLLPVIMRDIHHDLLKSNNQVNENHIIGYHIYKHFDFFESLCDHKEDSYDYEVLDSIIDNAKNIIKRYLFQKK